MQQPEHNQIMEALLEIKGDVGEIKGEVKGINNHLEKINGKLDDHSSKIGNLQKGQTIIKTKIAMFVGIISLVMVGAVEFVKSQFK